VSAVVEYSQNSLSFETYRWWANKNLCLVILIQMPRGCVRSRRNVVTHVWSERSGHRVPAWRSKASHVIIAVSCSGGEVYRLCVVFVALLVRPNDTWRFSGSSSWKTLAADTTIDHKHHDRQYSANWQDNSSNSKSSESAVTATTTFAFYWCTLLSGFMGTFVDGKLAALSCKTVETVASGVAV